MADTTTADPSALSYDPNDPRLAHFPRVMHRDQQIVLATDEAKARYEGARDKWHYDFSRDVITDLDRDSALLAQERMRRITINMPTLKKGAASAWHKAALVDVALEVHELIETLLPDLLQLWGKEGSIEKQQALEAAVKAQAASGSHEILPELAAAMRPYWSAFIAEHMLTSFFFENTADYAVLDPIPGKTPQLMEILRRSMARTYDFGATSQVADIAKQVRTNLFRDFKGGQTANTLFGYGRYLAQNSANGFLTSAIDYVHTSFLESAGLIHQLIDVKAFPRAYESTLVSVGNIHAFCLLDLSQSVMGKAPFRHDSKHDVISGFFALANDLSTKESRVFYLTSAAMILNEIKHIDTPYADHVRTAIIDLTREHLPVLAGTLARPLQGAPGALHTANNRFILGYTDGQKTLQDALAPDVQALYNPQQAEVDHFVWHDPRKSKPRI